MAVQKNTQKSTNDFAQLGDLIKSQQQQPLNKEKNMPETNTEASSDKPVMGDEHVLEAAKAAGFDISQPHPAVTEFVSALNPYGSDQAEEGSRWVLTLASNDHKNPMSLHDFIVESYRDPTAFVLKIAAKQGDRNAYVIKKFTEMVDQTDVVVRENRQLKEEVNRLTSELQKRSEPAVQNRVEELEKEFNKALDQVVENAVNDMTNGFKEVSRPAPCLTPPASVITHRPIKPARTVPTGPELVTVRVEESSFWEDAAKAAVTGVVVGAAVYGTIKLCEHFFGDDE